MSANSSLKAIYIIGQRKPFYGQRIPESSCAGKETVDIDILITSRNGKRKIMQSIRITNPSMIKKLNQLSQFRCSSTKVVPIEKTLTDYIFRMSRGFKKDNNWRISSPTYPFLWFILNFQVAVGSTSLGKTTVFHARPSNLWRKKLYRENHDSNFLGGSFSNRDNVRASIQFKKSIAPIAPILLERSNEDSCVFPALKLASYFLPQSTQCPIDQIQAQQPFPTVATDQIPGNT